MNDQQQITAQEIFDKVVDHLATQKVQSRTKNWKRGDYSCLYRGPDGTQCAFGIFIPDECYRTSMEGYQSNSILSSAERLLDTGPHPAYRMDSMISGEFVEVLKPLLPHRELIALLQRAHDVEDGPSLWPEKLEEAAARFNLQFDRPAFEEKLRGVSPETCTCSAQPMTPHAEDCPLTHQVRALMSEALAKPPGECKPGGCSRIGCEGGFYCFDAQGNPRPDLSEEKKKEFRKALAQYAPDKAKDEK